MEEETFRRAFDVIKLPYAEIKRRADFFHWQLRKFDSPLGGAHEFVSSPFSPAIKVRADCSRKIERKRESLNLAPDSIAELRHHFCGFDSSLRIIGSSVIR